MSVLVPVSWGEVIDKITILEIKAERLTDAAKLANVTTELNELVAVREREFPNHAPLAALAAELKAINEKLWVIEDDIRDCERAKDFGSKFIELARAVYYTNDERAVSKRKINDLLGSALVEEKSYAPYA
jgi:CHAT domain-containing protein